MNMISGSTGLSGAADSTFVLQKSSRLANIASLHCTGRDIPDRTLKLEFGEEDHVWKLLEDSKTCSGASKISTLQLVHLFSELLRADPTYLGSPSALSAKIDPDGSLGITPKKVTRLVRESVAALRENGVLAETYRSNGKRWISLKRAESADFLPVKQSARSTLRARRAPAARREARVSAVCGFPSRLRWCAQQRCKSQRCAAVRATQKNADTIRRPNAENPRRSGEKSSRLGGASIAFG